MRASASLYALIAAGQYDLAAAIAETLLGQTPDDAGLWHARGYIALQLGHLEAASRSLERAVDLAPHHAAHLTALGSVLAMRGRFKEAEAVLHRAWRLDAQDRGSLYKLACVLRDLGKVDEAVMLARRLVQQDAADGPAWRLLGDIALRKNDLSAALRAFERALPLSPPQAMLHYETALAALAAGQLRRAREALDAALALDPKLWAARAARLKLKRALCDWSALADDREPLLELARLELPGADVATLLDESADPAVLLGAARAESRSRQRQVADLPRPALRAPPRRGPAVPLRLGLLGDRFGDEPVGRAVVDLLERLKSQAVELTVFSTRLGDGSAIRKRIQDCWPVVELEHWPAARAAQRIADAGLHVLLDVSAPTNAMAATVLALGPCAQQVRWLNAPASAGAPWIQVLLADSVTIPAHEHRHYSERVLNLPTCVLPIDARRSPPPVADRARFGLPAEAVVLACLGDPAALHPAVCAAWARILLGAPRAVLWLAGGLAPEQVLQHLRGAFALHGVAPERILLAGAGCFEDVLAQLTVVDLYLDPWPHGGRFEVADALLAGCPVLTWPGRHAAGRFAASLNAHLGLVDLNCLSLQQYIDTAIAIANNPAAPEVLRETVRQARLNSPAFDLRRSAVALVEACALLADA